MDHEGSPTVYSSLVENYYFSSVEEARLLFIMVETYKIVSKEMGIINGMSVGLNAQRISLGCALAIAGTLATTLGAIGVTGGAALIIWLVSKGIATASLIEACT